MTTIIDDPIISLSDSSSMDDLRDAMNGTEPKPKEPVEEPEVEQPETGTGVVDEPEESTETELPKGVQKRIAKEVERQALIQREIDKAKSNTLAKEAELAKLTGKPGTEPVKPKADEDAEPEPPDFEQFDDGVKFKAAQEKYKVDHREWVKNNTQKSVQAELQSERSKQAAQDRWNAAVKEHGDKWESAAKTLVEQAPESLQFAVSALDDWSKVAVHLADNPAELAVLSEQFKAQPGSAAFFKAVANLGRLEAKITATEPEKTVAKPKIPPAPLKKITADPTGEEGEGGLSDKSSMSEIANFMRKQKLV